MQYNILVVKETRAGETRVALIPKDVEALTRAGHLITVEHNAGLAAGYNNELYQAAGAKITRLTVSNSENYKIFFENFNMIVRVKRPNLEREQLEHRALPSGTIMLGALDPYEHGSNHTQQYRHAGLIAYSIDQAILSPDDPMNILAAMSRLTGKLALTDAIAKCKNPIDKVVIIGIGTAGQSALNEAITLKLPVIAVVGNNTTAKEFKNSGIKSFFIDRTLPLSDQQQTIANIISDADIVITTARKAGQQAPLLIPKSTLDVMKPHAVVVDLAISEGGNVQGSKHDETISTDNNVVITNVSGYPKIMPNIASELWSKASLHFILALAKDKKLTALAPC